LFIQAGFFGPTKKNIKQNRIFKISKKSMNLEKILAISGKPGFIHTKSTNP
jgi:hypothetical protein